MIEHQRCRAVTMRGLVSQAWRCLSPLLVLVALLLMAAPVGSAAAGAPPARPGGDQLALMAVQQAALADPDAAAGDSFGYAVAVDGDTALVGAEAKTVAGRVNAGAVFVYTRTGTTWSQQTELTAADGAATDYFGGSVALAGDTAVVGAYGKSVGGHADAGVAYIYTRAGTVWSQKAELSDPDAAAGDYFGISVALAGDTALVGAYGAAFDGHAGAGAAYVYTRTGTAWSQQAELTADDAAVNDYFGYSVALSGDTALVGAAYKTVSGQSSAGAAYVFTRTGTTWPQQAKLSDPDAATNDQFGSSLALSGGTALVGAEGKAVDGQTGAGAAYICASTGANWSQQAELSDPDAAESDAFGSSVALAGDKAVVGARWKTVGGYPGAGAAYIYTRTGATWPQQAELSDPDAATNDRFGWSVALSGDTALVGAAYKTVGGQSGAGAAYVDVLRAAPSLSLKAAPHRLQVGKQLALSGRVKHLLASVKKVRICRQVGRHLDTLATLKLTRSGAFRWAMKPHKRGKWVFVAVYEDAGAHSLLAWFSKPVTVTVHK